MIIHFATTGNPVTQGNKSAFVHRATGKAIMREGRSGEANRAFKAWRTDVAIAARAAYEQHNLDGLIEGPVAVKLHFSLLRPASHPKTRRTWPTGKKGDVDKFARAVLDAITATLLLDDGQVVGLAVTKDWGNPPGVEVTISTVPIDTPRCVAALSWVGDEVREVAS